MSRSLTGCVPRMAKTMRIALSALTLAGGAVVMPLAHAHGTHLWFLSPENGVVVHDRLTFDVEAPYARQNKYLHILVTRQCDAVEVWKELVERSGSNYTVSVDVSTWPKGTFRADVTLLGALVQHPVSRTFSVE